MIEVGAVSMCWQGAEAAFLRASLNVRGLAGPASSFRGGDGSNLLRRADPCRLSGLIWPKGAGLQSPRSPSATAALTFLPRRWRAFLARQETPALPSSAALRA